MPDARLKSFSGDAIPIRGGFCGCCGSMYLNPRMTPEVLKNPKGICVYSGKRGKEVDTPLNSVKHVNTPEGWVTVVVAKKWE